MISYTFRSSRPDNWTDPRPWTDASLRYQKHGPVQPMERPSLWQRLMGRG